MTEQRGRTMASERCSAICSTHGQRCRFRARAGGMCGLHGERSTGGNKVDDGDHLEHANELLVQAMRHTDWARVPGPIRHLVEHAHVELWQEVEPDGGSS